MADIAAERRQLLEKAQRQVEEALASRWAVEQQIKTSKRLIEDSRRILANARAGRKPPLSGVSR
jgi:hypothetical protein